MKTSSSALVTSPAASISPPGIEDASYVSSSSFTEETEQTLLHTYSLRGQTDSLRERSIASQPVLGQVALKGQSTVFYAAPNTGKTLLTLNLLVQAIEAGIVIPNLVFYVNMDDSSEGLLEKALIAEKHGFHMLAGGENNFEPGMLTEKMHQMASNNSARGCFIVIDTLKKLVDLMQKNDCTQFGKIIRSFTQAGGTVIALAHTNKHASMSGKAVHGGTADIIQDFDCSYVMSSNRNSDDTVVVKFENNKKRGNVMQECNYSYSDKKGISYEERFQSVRLMDQAEVAEKNFLDQKTTDSEAIQSITKHIGNSSISKRDLMQKVCRDTGLSRDKVSKIIDRYAGQEEGKHLWSVTRGAHGIHSYKILFVSPDHDFGEF